MKPSTWEEAKEKQSLSAARKAKREEKAATLWTNKPKKKKSPSLSKLKRDLWKEISLYVRAWDDFCWACDINPVECAAHIVPANDGAMTRFFLPNLYPCCFSCNEAERRQRGSWVYRHREIFGDEYVDCLYAMSEDIFQIKKPWVLEQIERVRKLRGNA